MTLLLIAVGVGAVVTFLNEFIKQDGWPKQANAALALVVQAVAAFGVAVQHAGGIHGVDWSDVTRALVGAAIGFLAIYQPVVKGLLGDVLQPATSIVAAKPPSGTGAVTDGPRRTATPAALPFQLPAGSGIVEFKAMFDADKNHEDIWAVVHFADGHQELQHGWFVDGFGWVGPEVIFAVARPAAATPSARMRTPAQKK